MTWATMSRDVMNDVVVALRTMRRSPGLSVTAIIILALGCAITGAVFSTVNGWLSVGASIPHADRLIVVAPTHNGAERPTGYFKEPSYRRLLELKLRTIGDLFATRPVEAILSRDGTSVNIRMEVVTGAYFAAVGMPPLLGRALRPDDDHAQGGVPIVLGELAWRRLFAGDQGVIGRPVHVSGLLGTIVGVMPRSVRGFNVPSTTMVDVWAPMAGARGLVAGADGLVSAQIFGRLAEGASFSEAQAEMGASGSGFDPDDPTLGAVVLPVESGVMPSRVRFGLHSIGSGLIALSALVLLIACANLANLLLARSAGRSAETAIRLALGASHARILRLQLVETGCLTVLGGAAGFVLVSWTSRLIGRVTFLTSGGGTGTGMLLVDGWLLAYFFLLISVAAVAVGILPALRATRMDPGQVLASSGTRGRTTGRFERKRTLLVASQVAASTVLLVVAGLFLQSAWHASRYGVGFDTRHLATGSFDFGLLGWDEQRGAHQQGKLLAAARSIPGVRGAALSTGLPAGGGGERVSIEAEDTNLTSQEFGSPCRCLSVSPGFFDVLGLRLRQGRDFTAGDTAAGGGVVIVNEIAASQLWPGRDPVGRRLSVRKGDPLTVVGLVADVDPTAQEVAERCYAFVPMAQGYEPRFFLAIAGSAPAASLIGPLSATLARAVPDAPMFNVTTAEAYLNRAGGPARSVALALIVLGAIGLTIAIVGLYGVMSYVVGLRRAEFGIRKVLGATDAQIYGLVTVEALRMIAIGIAVGLPIAYAVSVLVGSALVGVTPGHGLTYVGVPACLMVIGAAAAWWPARQAARVEPAVALRDL